MHIPTATYRVQLHKGFGFEQLERLLPYLRELGISDLYVSPIFKARAGSLHGYDVVDPTQLNPELGAVETFEAIARDLRRHDLGWLQDIVPNHMAYDSENRMLMDVLENGPASRFANFFDINWDHPYESMRGKVLAPCLGQFYSECLENGEIVFRYDAQGLSVQYYQQRFPLRIESYNKVFAGRLSQLRKRLGSRHPDFVKLLGVLYTLKNLASAEEAQERADQILFVKSMLWELYTTSEDVKAFIDESVADFNGRNGIPESFNALDQLLAEQYYRLSYWKVATEEINYRRFFNVNDLISLCIDEPRVFETTHALVFQLIEEGKITGLRIDHIDGLYDPAAYLKRIREKAGDLYVVVEKILGLEESLPEHWSACGTTGYDFVNHVNGLFCQMKHEKRFSEIYTRFTGFRGSYRDLVTDKKRLLIGKHMAGDVDNLAHLLKSLSSRDRFGSDITLYGLRRALVEVLTFFPVYRSYINPEHFSDADHQRMRGVMERAKEMNPALLHELAFIEKFLLLENGEHLTEEEKSQWVHFIMRLQQLTGPLMAKGFEDTTLYVYNRLLSLNEVGGNPAQFGISLPDFHEFNQQRARHWPHTLNATSTHDTKRGEDARARLNVLSEIPDEWEKSITRWSRTNRQHKLTFKGQQIPDANDEYFLYQSLVGALPFDPERDGFVERVKRYMIKAVREAKVHTEWIKPDVGYEEAFVSFIDNILRPSEANQFLADFLPFARKISFFGALNSLAQTLLKIVSPGVPDFYQGTELWDLSFVDPDNRRPVAFEHRIKMLDELRQKEKKDLPGLLHELLSDWTSGAAKLFVTYKGLDFRRSQSALFQQGAYTPVRGSGMRKEHICAFARHGGNRWALTLVPRYLTRLIETGAIPLGESVWGETNLVLPEQAPDHWQQIFTGESCSAMVSRGKRLLPVRLALHRFPVALLVSDESAG